MLLRSKSTSIAYRADGPGCAKGLPKSNRRPDRRGSVQTFRIPKTAAVMRARAWPADSGLIIVRLPVPNSSDGRRKKPSSAAQNTTRNSLRVTFMNRKAKKDSICLLLARPPPGYLFQASLPEWNRTG